MMAASCRGRSPEPAHVSGHGRLHVNTASQIAAPSRLELKPIGKRVTKVGKRVVTTSQQYRQWAYPNPTGST